MVQTSSLKPQPQTGTPAPQKRYRTKKTDMAFNIDYVDDKGTNSKRNPTKVAAVRVISSDGKINIIRLSDIPQDVRGQMEADAIKRKLSFLLKDTKKTNPVEVHTITNSFVKSVKDGSIFTYKSGGGPGRAVDFEFWADVFALAAEIKIDAAKQAKVQTTAKLMTEKDREALIAKFEAMPKAEWEANKKKWNQNKLFANAALKVRSERAEAKLGKEILSSDIDFANI